MDGLPPDVRSLWYHMKNQEKDLRRKRQWLMGFPEPASSGRKRLKSDNELMLSETMLREDDLFYEHLKEYVEKGFGAHHETVVLPSTDENVKSFVQHDMLRMILALLDDFTNNGLYLLAKVIGGNSVVFEKTRWKMKKFIKENMSNVLGKQCNDGKEVTIYRKLSRILKNPHNFFKNHTMLSADTANLTIHPTVQSHYGAIMDVLKELKGMSLQTLSAMYRRLKGVQRSPPVFSAPRSGWTKPRLVNRVKSLSLKLLSQLGKLDELPEPLIKAMSVASLSLKLSDNQNASLSNFCRYTPEIESLQNEIVKAINLLNCKVGVQELKCLKKLLAPESEYRVQNGGLRKVIKKMLIEFLFYCCDMDEIPSMLLDVLDVINSCVVPQKEVIEEVESILNVSAQVKQVLWDFLSDFKLDLEFSDAYIEDLEDSDDGDLFDDHDEEEGSVKVNLDDISEVGSTGDPDDIDSNLFNCTPTCNVNGGSTVRSESRLKTEIKAEPDDMLFTPSFGDSKSFNYTASLSMLHQATTTAHIDGMKDSISRFTLYSSSVEHQTEERQYYQSSCKYESANLAEGCESNYFSREKMKDVSDKPCMSRNKYLAIQEVCDEACLIAYRLIGHVLEGYACTEELDLDQRQLSYLNGGCLTALNPQDTVPNQDQATSIDDVDGSIIIQAVRGVIPSFSHSELEKVRKLLK